MKKFRDKYRLKQLTRSRAFAGQGVTGEPGDFYASFIYDTWGEGDKNTSGTRTFYLGKHPNEKSARKQADTILIELKAALSIRTEAHAKEQVFYEEFTDSFIASKRGADTRRRYENWRGHLERYWKINNMMPRFLNDIEYKHLHRYEGFRRAEGAAPWTVASEVTFIKALLNDAFQLGYFREKFWDRIKNPKKVKLRPTPSYTIEQLEGICEHSHPNLADTWRFLFFTGCRRNEVRFMEFSWIEWDKKRVRIPREIAKRGEDLPPKYVKLGPTAFDILVKRKAWVEDRSSGDINNRRVFVSAMGNPFESRNSLHKALQTCGNRARRAGVILPDRLTLHQFRHSCATELRRRGASLEDIQFQLDHRDSDTTKGYGETPEPPGWRQIIDDF